MTWPLSVCLSFSRECLTIISSPYLHVFTEIYYEQNPPKQLPWDPSKKTIAIIGTGWASVAFLTTLDTSNYNVVIVSPRNYFLFTPLLPSTTVGTIDLRSILQPIRFITRFKERETMFVEGECKDIDPVKKTILIEGTSFILKCLSS